MIASQIVDKLIENGPIEPGEFLSNFPLKRATGDDFHAVIQKLLALRQENGGQWSDTGDISVSVFGGDPIENFRPEHATYDHFQKIIDFDAAVMSELNGEIIQQGIAQENTLDVFYGWQAYLDLTDDGPMKFSVAFGKNDPDSGSFEPDMPPRAKDACQAHFAEFKAKFIDKVTWLQEASRVSRTSRQQWKKQLADAPPEVQAADEFYRGYMGGVEAGKKIRSAGALAAYTFDWPEFTKWTSHSGSDIKGDEYRSCYGSPNEQWQQHYQGSVYYEGRSIYAKGQKGRYTWRAEWSYGSSYNFTPHLKVDIEFWDRDRIWQSHWKKPVLWDYKLDRENPRAGTKAEWDDASPELFDTIDLDQAIKDRLVKSAKAFVDRLSQVAEIGRVRWNVPELYVPESMGDDMLQQMGAVASKNRYVELLALFCKTFKRHGGDTGPEIDEACWRPIIIKLGLGDVAWRATEIMDAGYELLRGDQDAEDAWSDAVIGLVTDRKIAVSDEDYQAVKRLWHFRYQDEDAFIQYATGITETKQPSTKGWEQVGGDFGNPWDYGGTWYSAQTEDIVHFPGVEGEKDIESSSPKVDMALTAADYRKIVSSVSLDDFGGWENVEDEIRQNKAEQLTAAIRHTYYRTSVEDSDVIDKDWAREIAEIKRECEISDEDWANTTAASKQDAIASRIGWEEFDHYPGRITRGELSQLLGIEL